MLTQSMRWLDAKPFLQGTGFAPSAKAHFYDRLPASAFEEGFGLQTPLVNGQLNVVRYYPYFEPTDDKALLYCSVTEKTVKASVSAIKRHM